MSHDPTRRAGPEDDDSYDWDLDDEPQGGGILWGRVLALATIVLLAFFLGRLTGGSDDGSEEAALRSRLRASEHRVEELEAQAAAEPSPEAQASPSPEPSPSAEGDGQTLTYTVKAGDTLRGIAERFYGDVTLDDVIAEANGIADAGQLNVGQELTIPPEP
jgi:nucleoid-associated protein YgaU